MTDALRMVLSVKRPFVFLLILHDVGSAGIVGNSDTAATAAELIAYAIVISYIKLQSKRTKEYERIQ